MRVAFRTDSSPRIGVGHVMRCVNLASALRERGAEVLFVSREMTRDAAARIADCDMPLRQFPTDRAGTAGVTAASSHSHWLSAPVEQDAAETAAALASFAPDWLVVDHYGIGSSWERSLRSAAPRVLVIDDLADREHDCDVLLDQNYFVDPAGRYRGRIGGNTALLTGPHYALLRREFSMLHASARPRERVARLLVFMGGGDQSAALLKVAQALDTQQLRELEIDVVLGGAVARRAQIEDRLRTLPRVRVHTLVEDMPAMILRADLCIGAGGVSVWERACLGLPSVVLAVAEHQIEPAQAMAAAERILYLGTFEAVAPADIAAAVAKLAGAPAALRAMSERLQALVDGRGAQRVCEVLQ